MWQQNCAAITRDIRYITKHTRTDLRKDMTNSHIISVFVLSLRNCVPLGPQLTRISRRGGGLNLHYLHKLQTERLDTTQQATLAHATSATFSTSKRTPQICTHHLKVNNIYIQIPSPILKRCMRVTFILYFLTLKYFLIFLYNSQVYRKTSKVRQAYEMVWRTKGALHLTHHIRYFRITYI